MKISLSVLSAVDRLELNHKIDEIQDNLQRAMNDRGHALELVKSAEFRLNSEKWELDKIRAKYDFQS